jgi:hypothetical protein
MWILHQGIRYDERGPAVNKEAKQARTRKMIRELRGLGYRVELALPRNVPLLAQPNDHAARS